MPQNDKYPLNATVSVLTRRDLLIAAGMLSISGCLKRTEQSIVEDSRDDVAANPFVLIEGGVFMMGSDSKDDNNPAHQVRLDRFLINNWTFAF